MNQMSRRMVLGGAAGTAALTAFPFGADAADAGGGLRPVRLTTEHLTDPLGLDAAAPRFGWQLDADGTGRAQTAYRIAVASSRKLLEHGRPDVWDSGRVASAGQSALRYAGPALRPRTRYHWTVRVWDERGRPGPAGEPAWFETALMSEQDWTAGWIGTGVELPPAVRVLEPQRFGKTELTGNTTLGQTFRSAGPLATVAVLLAVEGTAGCTMTLRRGGPGGEVLGRTVLSGLTADTYGQAHGRLDLPEPAGAGDLFVELSAPRGTIAWVGVPHDAYPGGSAHVDGRRVAGDRWVYGIPPEPPANPLLRTEFRLAGPVVAARLYLAGLGHAIAWINGRRVGDAELSPATTDYDRRVLYTTHDVTGLLRAGANAVGVALGRGFFATRAPDTDGSNLARWVAEPRLRAQLEVTLAGGARVVVGTGPSWRVTEGPTTSDGVYAGESYDARRAAELDGWTTPGPAGNGWRAAATVDGPGGALVAYPGEPVREGGRLRPVSVREHGQGRWVLDFGVLIGGWARLRGHLPEGATVRLQYGEKLGTDGRVHVGIPGGNENQSVHGRYQADEYTAAGGEVSWHPSFTYKSFRYLEVSGTARRPDVVAVPVHSDVADTMKLHLGQPVLQWIADAFERTAINGIQGHPGVAALLKQGWTSATYRATAPMLYRFGMATIFAKWLEDIRLSQAPDGELTLIAPQGRPAGGRLLTPSSTGVYPYLVRRYWLTYGDRTVPERHFDAVRRYVDWLLGMLRDGIADDPFGDWYPPDGHGNPAAPEGGTLAGTAYVVQTLRDATALAELVGQAGHARAWRARTRQLTRRFTDEFLDAASATYRTDVDAGYRQTSNAVPLAFGLVPAEHEHAVAAGLARAVEANGDRLDTGALGTGALPFALSDHDRADLAHAVLGRADYPSYGYLRSLGASTFWESWEPESRGHNDTTLSLPVQWLVERVLGVEPLEPGYARFRIAPRAFGPLPEASLRLETVRGRIEVSWRRRSAGFVLDALVPVNAVAELVLPDGRRRELGSGRHRVHAPIR